MYLDKTGLWCKVTNRAVSPFSGLTMGWTPDLFFYRRNVLLPPTTLWTQSTTASCFQRGSRPWYVEISWFNWGRRWGGEQGICEKKLSYDETFQSDMDFDVIVGWGSSDDSSRESTQNYTAWRGRHLWPVIEKSQCQGCIAKVSDISQYHIHYYEFSFTLTNVTI